MKFLSKEERDSMTREELINDSPCDAKCPILCYSPRNGMRGCCNTCDSERMKFAENGGLDEFTDKEKEIVRTAWDEDVGFASKEGCKLPRKLMPIECLKYDCRNIRWFLGLAFVTEMGSWQLVSRYAVPMERMNQELADKYNDFFLGIHDGV